MSTSLRTVKHSLYLKCVGQLIILVIISYVSRNALWMHVQSCTDPERGSRTPLKNHKAIGFPSNTGWLGSSEKSQSYQASIRCFAITGLPAKCHLNFFSLEGCLWPAFSGIRIKLII